MNFSTFAPVSGWQKWLGLAIAVIVVVAIARKLPFVKSYV